MGRSHLPWRGALRWLVAGVLALLALGVGADVDLADYDPRAAPKDRQAQARDTRQVELDKQAEARREAALSQEAERLKAAQRRLDEARPWPVRLTEQRCTRCHAASNYRANGHTLIGWWGVAIRMKQVNGAPVSWHELTVIVPHLAEQYPAHGADRVIEWGVLAAVLGLSGVGFLVGGRWQRRRRRTESRPVRSLLRSSR